MDPNETLRRLREQIETIRIEAESGGGDFACDVAEAVELFQALDGYLSKGGFLPEEWKP